MNHRKYNPVCDCAGCQQFDKVWFRVKVSIGILVLLGIIVAVKLYS